MTAEEWARLRCEADKRRIRAQGHYPLDQYILAPIVVPFVPPVAGSWVRLWYGPRICWPDGWATSRWHRFNGDMRWRPAWETPSLATACGYEIGSSTAKQLRVVDDTPESACLRCLRVN